MLTGIKIIRKADKISDSEEPDAKKKWKTNEGGPAQVQPQQEQESGDTRQKWSKDVNDDIFLKDIHKQRLKEKVWRDMKFNQKKTSDLQSDEEKNMNLTKGQQIKQQRKEQNKQRRQFQKEKKVVKALENCPLCLENCKLGEKSILSNGNRTLLLLPNIQCYAGYYHFYLIPIDHIDSIRDSDEETWEEVRNFMKCLVSAFDALDMEVIFFENAFEFKKSPHCKLEVVVVPYAITKEANLDLYFRQGMEDLDGFWSTHRKIINISKDQGGIRKQIPKGIEEEQLMNQGFPYFYVDIGLKSGLAHVIENEIYFSENFAKEILASVLKIEKNRVLYPKDYLPEDSKKVYDRFQKLWQKFDWTSVLREQQEVKEDEEKRN